MHNKHLISSSDQYSLDDVNSVDAMAIVGDICRVDVVGISDELGDIWTVDAVGISDADDVVDAVEFVDDIGVADATVGAVAVAVFNINRFFDVGVLVGTGIGILETDEGGAILNFCTASGFLNPSGIVKIRVVFEFTGSSKT